MFDESELMEVSVEAERLLDWCRQLPSAAIAFSGGVDSSVVAAAAFRSLGDKVLAVTAKSPSVSAEQLEWAEKTATEIGIRHVVVNTSEVDLADYQRNDSRRCFFCKQSLYETLGAIAQHEGLVALLSGTNADDLGDYRPGIQAGADAAVRTPLADLGIPKPMVRKIAKFWGLGVWDQPAAPCLASRIAYGVPVTAARLDMIEQAEAWLRSHGMKELRVRLHAGELARVEVPLDHLAEMTASDMAARMVARFNEIGFRYVTVDLAGLRSGNLNQLIQIGTRAT